MGYDKMGFETKVCSRCGGTGHYSYCTAYGSRCFKCQGAKYIYTAKGLAALNFFRESMEIPAGQIKVGMLHRSEPGRKWFPVIEVGNKIASDGDINYSTNGCTYHKNPNSMVTAIVSNDEYTEKLIEAIRFQSRLTKAGKEMKKYLKIRGEA